VGDLLLQAGFLGNFCVHFIFPFFIGQVSPSPPADRWLRPFKLAIAAISPENATLCGSGFLASGEWADGNTDSGPFVACTHENLSIALRWLIIQNRIAQVDKTCAEVDSATVLRQVQRIRTSLDRVKTMNRKVTDVRASANEIQTEAEALRDEVRASLANVEDAIRAAAPVVNSNEAVSVAVD
jgi:hypothetical protein